MIVPAGFAGSIAVDFQEPVYWRIAEVISLLAVMGVVVVIFVGSKKRKQYGFVRMLWQACAGGPDGLLCVRDG